MSCELPRAHVELVVSREEPLRPHEAVYTISNREGVGRLC